MRLSVPAALIGSLGALVQKALDGANALFVQIGNYFGDDITQAGQAFIVAMTSGPVAAQNSTCEVFNPAASGVFLYIDRVYVRGSAVASSATLGFTSTALATDLGTLVNKNQGGAASLSHQRTSTQAGNPAAFTGLTVRDTQSNVDQFIMDMKPPLRISAGNGLAIVNSTVNQAISCNIECREKTT